MSLLISFYWVNYYCNDGAVLMNYSTFVKDTLFEKIHDMAQYQWLFVQNTEEDFTRKRKLDFKTMLQLFSTMESL